LLSGSVIALISGFAPIDRAAELVNIGTLTAFAFVCFGVSVLRITHPDLHRPFKLPFNPLIPVLGVLSCVWLMLQLPTITWARFVVWSALGLIIYFCYGIKNSKLQQEVK
jgi:basic amino acid/polyamine antiporter, APA family